jgi:hypothetical protein
MCNLLGVMDHHGFELVASVDQSIGSDNVGERKYYLLEVGRADG